MKMLLLFFFVFFSISCFAQHQHEQMPAKKDTIPPKDDMSGMNMQNDTVPNNNMRGIKGMEGMKMDMMSHAYSRNLPMSRNGSGTSWMPDASPTYMYMKMKDKSMFMLHGNIFLRYTKQDLFDKGSRGDDHFDAPDWFMGMYNRLVGKKGLFNATAMISFDPFLVGEGGYPLLFQTGELYQGKKLVDRQHPHDLFSGLSIGYTQMLSKDADVIFYFGYPGEPALGPPAFMHRISTMDNPDAPIGHHWQDATHITFGVGTLGFRYKNFKIESSIFAGREPDENRYDFDHMRFDSYSYRLSLNPSQNWAIQFSQGFIHSPESLEPEINVTRTTASVIYSKWLNKRYDYFTQSLIWGLNHSNNDITEHSLLYEGDVHLDKQAIYYRYEFVQKSADELDLATIPLGTNFNINAFTLGDNYTFYSFSYADLAAGIQATVNFTPKDLQSLYGRTPLAGEIYLQLKPHIHRHQ